MLAIDSLLAVADAGNVELFTLPVCLQPVLGRPHEEIQKEVFLHVRDLFESRVFV